MEESDFERLVSLLYRCPGDRTAWESFASVVAAAHGGDHAQIVVFGAGGACRAEFSTFPALGARYVADYAARDVSGQLALRQPVGGVTWSRTLIEAGDLARCPVQNELLPEMGAASRSWMHGVLADGGRVGLALFHAAGFGGPDERAALLAGRLRSHLEQAMQLHLAVEAARDGRRALEDGIEGLGIGRLLLDRNGGVVHASASARAALSGGAMRLVDGVLAAVGTVGDAALRRVVAAAVGRAGPPRAGQVVLDGVRVQVTPVGEAAMLREPGVAAVVLVRDARRGAAAAGRLLRLGLTGAEARLASALAEGETVEGYARRTGRASSTVRAQLQAVFGKLGVRRQAELVLRLGRIAASDDG